LIGKEDGSNSIAAILCVLRFSNLFSILLETEERDSEHVPERKYMEDLSGRGSSTSSSSRSDRAQNRPPARGEAAPAAMGVIASPSP
jgi:hypothetical protein